MTTTYTTAATAAATVRAAIKKELGLGPKDVSVRCENFAGGSSVNLRIRSERGFDAQARIREIAEGAERVSRCELTGEILSGGNRYVSVDLDADALRPLVASRYLDRVRAAWPTLKPHGGANDWAPLDDELGLIIVARGATVEVERRWSCGGRHWVSGRDAEEMILSAAYGAAVLAARRAS